MGLSFLIIAIIVGWANVISWFGRRHAEIPTSKTSDLQAAIVPPKHFILLRVLLDEHQHASLSLFQLLMWTLLISFLYLSLWCLQFLAGGTKAPPAIPGGLMALMGLSVGVPLVSKGISEYKKFKPRLEGEIYEEPRYASMLEEEGRPSLLRFQMFFWTLASLVVYSWSFVNTVLVPLPEGGMPGLPDVDPTLLFLMGLSQTGYLGGMAYAGTLKKEERPAKVADAGPTVVGPPVAGKSMAIREIIPTPALPNEKATIIGSGFGATPDTIILGEEMISSDNIHSWTDTRIEFTVPGTAVSGTHTIQILSGGRSVRGVLTAGKPPWMHEGIDKTAAEIISEIWIDDPVNKWYRLPPIGHFITGKRYYFFFEFSVPPGIPSWGRTEFGARFYIDGKQVGDPRSFMPGYMNGKNYGVFDHIFEAAGQYTIEIRGANTKSMQVEVRKPAGL